MTRLDGTPWLIRLKSEDTFRALLAYDIKGILSLESTFEDSYVDEIGFNGHPRRKGIHPDNWVAKTVLNGPEENARL